jgi:hypothetical protein
VDRSLELKLSLLACLAISAGYAVYAWVTTPSGGHPIGYALGIIGMLLMLSTETLYSLRKRVSWLRWAGPLRWWLSAHIFTGIVGPFLVLTHSAFRFQGVAGFTLALTGLVVASGFFGRYLYTAIPRTQAGVEATAAELEAEIELVRGVVRDLARQRSAAVQALVEAETRPRAGARGGWWMVLARSWDERRYRSQLSRRIRQLEKAERRRLNNIEHLLAQRRRLERQMQMLDSARRLFSWWHVGHVPLGLALFGSAAVHIVATFYFGAGPWP